MVRCGRFDSVAKLMKAERLLPSLHIADQPFAGQAWGFCFALGVFLAILLFLVLPRRQCLWSSSEKIAVVPLQSGFASWMTGHGRTTPTSLRHKWAGNGFTACP